MDMADISVVTKSQLAAAFRTLGISDGQAVMLHASVKAIGWILGGPRVVLETLLDILGPQGTLMMLTSWEGAPYHLGDSPGAQRDTLLVECPPFDPVTSPADHREMSILAEYLRTWPDAYRSNHPLASFVAVGAQAQWLTRGQPLQYPHGLESPLARLCAAGGNVVMLGDLLSNLTLLHHAEHLASIPTKQVDRYQMPILHDGRRIWVDIEEYDTTNGIADFGSDDYFLDIGRAYLDGGRGRIAQVGNAPSYLFAAEDLKQFGIHWLEAHYKGPVQQTM